MKIIEKKYKARKEIYYICKVPFLTIKDNGSAFKLYFLGLPFLIFSKKILRNISNKKFFKNYTQHIFNKNYKKSPDFVDITDKPYKSSPDDVKPIAF